MESLPAPRTGVNNSLIQEWSKFLGTERWDLFCTWTFKGDSYVPAECIIRRIRRWLYSCLLDHAVLKGLADPPIKGERHRGRWPQAYRRQRPWATPQLVIGIESTGRTADHAHGMIQLPEFARDMRRDKAWAKWFYPATAKHLGGEFGWGFAKIEPPQSEAGAMSYVVKASGYVAKGGELYLSESLRLPTLPVCTAPGNTKRGRLLQGEATSPTC